MPLSPVLLFTYNRPDHTARTLEALQKNRLAEQSELYVFSDGHKNGSDRKEVEEVRRMLRTIEGFGKVHLVEHKQNRGLAKNIIEGVTQVIRKQGRVIVLEDDLITAPYFLTFMNEALERFQDEELVGHIHGYCYPGLGLPYTFLIKWTGSWGWATWARAWQHFNPDGSRLLRELEERKLTATFDFNGSYPYTRMLRRQIKGENDSWAIRWNASLFLKGMLSVNAGRSLVENIGFDGSGTHSGSQEIYTTTLYTEKPDITPQRIEENQTARRAYERYYKKSNGFRAKVRRRIKRHLGI